MNLIHLETRDQSRIDICSYFCCGFDLVLTQPWLLLYETCFSSVSGFICNMTNVNSLGIAKCRILSLVKSFQMLLFEYNDSFGFYAVLVFCLLSLSLKLMWLSDNNFMFWFVYFKIRTPARRLTRLVVSPHHASNDVFMYTLLTEQQTLGLTSWCFIFTLQKQSDGCWRWRQLKPPHSSLFLRVPPSHTDSQPTNPKRLSPS